MLITPKSLARFLEFLQKTAEETYPEEPSTGHDAVTKRAMEYFFAHFSLSPTAKILDVGCGQGVALRPFQSCGFAPIGITLNPVDARICQEHGFDVQIMDQSFLDFDDNFFDLVWARHVVEHSITPFYTLTEFRRVVRHDGLLYLEVPASDTLGHENNKNHYSVLGKNMWLSLIARSGFEVVGQTDYFIKTVQGKTDTYWGFFARAVGSSQTTAKI